ncbi:RING-type E3 ubiquitin transferase [Salvia divinorum]|uniref:RING-type E3 ubiquitin transferase n=1 Tax=Salvia divinorum TaxID=28513 RepID=A0ABD1IND2_SALDI
MCMRQRRIQSPENSCVMTEKVIEASQLICSKGMKLAAEECAICLSKFAIGEQVRVLEKHSHGFQMQYIDDRAVPEFVLFMLAVKWRSLPPK